LLEQKEFHASVAFTSRRQRQKGETSLVFLFVLLDAGSRAPNDQLTTRPIARWGAHLSACYGGYPASQQMKDYMAASG
jgi:hypothetical protein